MSFIQTKTPLKHSTYENTVDFRFFMRNYVVESGATTMDVDRLSATFYMAPQ